ncbi:MAG: alanine racemase [Anaerolineae bacterium]
MAELGDASAEAHRAVGARAAAVVDVLVTRGREAEGIAAGARAAGLAADRVVVTYRAEDAVAAVLPWLTDDAVVLVKGSAVTRMEHVTAALMAAPERAADVLVRQDAAWRQIVVVRPDRPTWLEIDLGAIADNTRALKAGAGGAQLMAVIKADAYGHGALRVARTVLRNGADRLGVACLAEAAALRREGIDAPILVLGWTPAWQARDAVGLDAALAVYDMASARALDEAGRDLGRTVAVHVKVDTGLHRLGLPPGDAPDFLRALRGLPRLVVEGVFTHLAVADEAAPPSRAATDAQLAAFRGLLDALDAAGLRPPIAHAANSAAVLGRADAAFDMVRPGIALYGLAPSADVGLGALRPALSWKTQVAQVHDLAPGEAVGYGRTWTAARPSRVATIPVGYADGFRRGPQRWRHVLVREAEAPLVGRVSMDQAAVDVTDIADVRTGDEVVLIGRQGARTLSAETAAEWLGTINYEVVSQILARVARV